MSQAAALLIIARPRPDTAILGNGDLHTIDVIPVPERLEDRVGEPLDEKVLHGLLAKIMVDPEYLRLLKHAGDHPVELLRRGQIPPERLFDHHLRLHRRPQVPLSQARRPQVFQNRLKHRGRSRDVEQRLQVAAGLGFELLDQRVQAVEGGALVVSAGQIERIARHATPCGGIWLAPRELLDRRLRAPTELLVRDRLAPESDEVEIGRQQIVVGEIVDCGEQLAGREVSGGAKNHDNGRRRAAIPAQSLQERVKLRIGHARRHHRKAPAKSQSWRLPGVAGRL